MERVVSLDIYPGPVISVDSNASSLMPMCVGDTCIEKIEACRIHVDEDVLWSGDWLRCIVHEGKFRGVLPLFDHIGSHGEKVFNLKL